MRILVSSETSAVAARQLFRA